MSKDLKVMNHTDNDFCNIIIGDDAEEIYLTCFKHLGSILKSHCGNRSYNAAILRPSGSELGQYGIYTKDGISIIETLKYMSSAKDWIRAEVARVGKYIESDAGDGTTTGMLLGCELLTNILKDYDYVYPQLLKEYNEAVKTIVAYLDEACYVGINDDTVDPVERQNILRAIIYAQALSSSHGNAELAKAVVDIAEILNFRDIETFTYRPAPTQDSTEKTFTVETEDAEYAHHGFRMHGFYDLENNTALRREKATVIITIDSFFEGTINYEEKAIQRIMEEVHEATGQKTFVLVVSTAHRFNALYLRDITAFANEKGFDLVVWASADSSTLKTHRDCQMHLNLAYMNAPVVIAGVEALNDNNMIAILDDVDVYMSYDVLKFYRLNKDTRHWYDVVLKDKYHPVKKYIDDIEFIMKGYIRDEHNKVSNESEIACRRYIQNIKHLKSPKIIIHGKDSEVAAAMRVIDDVRGAVESAMQDGIYIAPYQHAARRFTTANELPVWFKDAIKTVVESSGVVEQTKRTSLLNVIRSIFGKFQTTDQLSNDEEYTHVFLHSDSQKQELVRVPKDIRQWNITGALEEGKPYPICQPKKSVTTTFDSIRAQLLPMACVRTIVDRDGVNTRDKVDRGN